MKIAILDDYQNVAREFADWSRLPLRGLDNVILTPHVGYVTRQTYEVFHRETLEAVQAFLAGAPVRVIGA